MQMRRRRSMLRRSIRRIGPFSRQDNERQLRDNLASAEVKLTGQLELIGAASALPPEYPGWMITVQDRRRLEASGTRSGSPRCPPPRRRSVGGRRPAGRRPWPSRQTVRTILPKLSLLAM
jgi:hypothetical protein